MCSPNINFFLVRSCVISNVYSVFQNNLLKAAIQFVEFVLSCSLVVCDPHSFIVWCCPVYLFNRINWQVYDAFSVLNSVQILNLCSVFQPGRTMQDWQYLSMQKWSTQTHYTSHKLRPGQLNMAGMRLSRAAAVCAIKATVRYKAYPLKTLWDRTPFAYSH